MMFLDSASQTLLDALDPASAFVFEANGQVITLTNDDRSFDLTATVINANLESTLDASGYDASNLFGTGGD
jgi:hypothetical protein